MEILKEIEASYLSKNENSLNEYSDFIFDLVKDFYDNAILTNFKPNSGQWTVFSSVILQNGNLFKVITFANGTKSLPNKNYSNKDSRIFDSHAEVLSLRSFKHFLVKLLTYSLMKRLNIANDDKYLAKEEFETFDLNNQLFDIFLWSSNDKVLLKDKVLFHLYVSELPCGDCSIVPIEFNNKADKLQTGSKVVECFKNNDYIKLPHNNEKGKCRSKSMRSDIDRDNISYSLSCSDKILLKNILGLQGKLLTRLIESIYLSTVTISTPNGYNESTVSKPEFLEAMSQGMNILKRNNNINKISLYSLGYTVNEPRVLLTKKHLIKERQDNSSSVSFSSYWYFGKVTFTKIDPIIGFKQGTISKPKSLEKARADVSTYDFIREYLMLVGLYSDSRNQCRNIHFDETIKIINEYETQVSKDICEMVKFISSNFYKYLKEQLTMLMRIDEFLNHKYNILKIK
jgi:tRNA-specific adenosine deaminase 1